MTHAVDQDVLDKLAKLKAKADSCKKMGSENEAMAFAKKLRELLVHHDIQMHELENATGNKIDDDIIERTICWDGFRRKQGRRKWTEVLGVVVCQTYDCKIVVKGHSDALIFIGQSSNVALAEFTIITIRRMAELVCHKRWLRYRDRKVNRNQFHAAGGEWKNGFLHAMLTRLHTRLKEMKRGQEETLAATNPGAMVWVGNKLAATQSFGDKKYPNKARQQEWGAASAEGMASGRRFADKLDLETKAMGESGTGPASQLR